MRGGHDPLVGERSDLILGVAEIFQKIGGVLADLRWIAAETEVVLAHLEGNPGQLGGDPGRQNRLEQTEAVVELGIVVEILGPGDG